VRYNDSLCTQISATCHSLLESGLSYSWIKASELIPCSCHKQKKIIHSKWILYCCSKCGNCIIIIIFKSLAGACAKSVKYWCHMLFIPLRLATFHCVYLSTPYLVAYMEAVIFCNRCKKVVEFVILSQKCLWQREFSCSFGFPFYSFTRPCNHDDIWCRVCCIKVSNAKELHI